MTFWIWAGFVVLVLGMLALDLGVFHRRSHVVSIREAAVWTGVWVVTALIFAVGVYYAYEYNWLGIGLEVGHDLGGRQATIQYLTGYIIEKSLSLDNIFVIALIFAYFNVAPIYQHRVLFWGILGALIMRGVMIAAGAALISRFSWMVYVFGGLLLLTALRMLVAKHEKVEPEHNPLLRAARRPFPVSDHFDGERFFTRIDGRRAITPMMLVLLVVESSDVVFAVDSIPAIFAVTRDPFLVFTSNVFAILGLRSLYFVLSGVIEKFRYMKISLVVLLAYVGVKMLLAHHYPIPTLLSLGIIVGILTIGIVASIVAARRDQNSVASAAAEEFDEFIEQSLKHARKVVAAVIGVSVLLVGLALTVLPGPAFVVIPAGLAILATEFVWARRLLRRIKRTGRRIWKKVDFRVKRPKGGGRQDKIGVQ